MHDVARSGTKAAEIGNCAAWEPSYEVKSVRFSTLWGILTQSVVIMFFRFSK